MNPRYKNPQEQKAFADSCLALIEAQKNFFRQFDIGGSPSDVLGINHGEDSNQVYSRWNDAMFFEWELAGLVKKYAPREYDPRFEGFRNELHSLQYQAEIHELRNS